MAARSLASAAMPRRLGARRSILSLGRLQNLARSASTVTELKTFEDYEGFERKNSVLYFTAKWCPPCKRIGPAFVDLSEKNPDIKFAKCDIDENPEATGDAGISSVPTFMFFRDGKLVTKFAGADQALLEDNIASLKER
ncbi:unnamed protein product [Phaeothamnion confervicola]